MSSRALTALVVVGALMLIAARAAGAATYTVNACGPSGQSTNHAWTLTDTLAGVESASTCGATGDYSGLYVRDRPGGTAAPLKDGEHAGWTFAAPAGLTINAITYKRWLYKSDDILHAALFAAGGRVLEECIIVFPAGLCESGGFGTAARTIGGLATSSLTVGVQCKVVPPYSRCSAGGSIQPAFAAALYDAAVTVSDNGAPVVSGLSGPLVSGGWQTGIAAATGTASDASGIKQFQILVDGNPAVSDPAIACDYTYAKPCQDRSAGGLNVDTSQLADGPHLVQAAAIDAAGNRALGAPSTIRVDRTPPQPPVGLSAPVGWQRDGHLTLTGHAPAGQVSPIVRARYEVCDAQGNDCFEGEATEMSSEQFTIQTTVGDGEHIVHVWLMDQAGNSGQKADVPVRVDVNAPQPPSGLRAQQHAGHIATLHWSTPQAPGSPVSTARVQLCQDGETCRAPQTLANTGSLHTGQLPAGSWTAKVWLADAAGNQDPDHPAIAHFSIKDSPSLHVSTRRAHHHRLLVRARLARAATGKLTVTVLARDRRGHGMRPIRRRLRIKHGHASTTIRLSPRARRARVSVSYAGNSRLLAQTRSATARRLS